MDLLVPEREPVIPTIPKKYVRSGGILAPVDYGRIELPEGAGEILKPRGYKEHRSLEIPDDRGVTQYGAVHSIVDQNELSQSEIALAFGNFDVYFSRKVAEYFPSHIPFAGIDLDQIVNRAYKDKRYFNRYSGRYENIRESRPGPLEEECVVALRIAAEPNFTTTAVASNAISMANTLLYLSRTSTREEYQEQLPEMPTLLDEAERYLGKLSIHKNLRYEVYDLIEQIKIPDSEKSKWGMLMARNGDLKHPLAYRLLTECGTDTEFYIDQTKRREMMLTLLEGNAAEITNNFHQLSELARGLVCSVDVKNPPKGRAGIEVEFGVGSTENQPNPKRFNVYYDPPNHEISRDFDNTYIDPEYLHDLISLSTFLSDGSTHISSLHLHLDRNIHPNIPTIGDLLGNWYGSTVVESQDKNTWEIRGILPPARGNRIEPATVADIIQLYIISSREKSEPEEVIDILDDNKVSLEQITFGHICRFVSSPEGRLAALKILEHPLAMKGVNPESLLEDYTADKKELVYHTLKKSLFGSYAKRSLTKIAYQNRQDWKTVYERLTEIDIYRQYQRCVEVYDRIGLLKRFDSGEFGIVGENGKEYPIPTIESILDIFVEKAEVLGPKMDQGFVEMLLVPFGMRLHELIKKYEESLRWHNKFGVLLGPNGEEDDGDILNLYEELPVGVSRLLDDTDDYYIEPVYYPEDFNDSDTGMTKSDLLEQQNLGWKVLLIEDMPILRSPGTGLEIAGRQQFVSGSSPMEYLHTLHTVPQYRNEVGMTPEDWLSYAILRLEKTSQVIDDYQYLGKAAYLPGAFYSGRYVPVVGWNRKMGMLQISTERPSVSKSNFGVRVAVRVN